MKAMGSKDEPRRPLGQAKMILMMCQKATLAAEPKGGRKEPERNCNHLRTEVLRKPGSG